MAGNPVSEKQREGIERKIVEIRRQLNLSGGYPFDPTDLERHLQGATEGRFLDQTFIETGELVVPIPALLIPTIDELRGRFSFIKSIHADRSVREATTLHLGTVLRPGEEQIDGVEYERRRVGLPMLSAQHGLWLEEHQEEFPAFMALRGKVYIDLPGLEIVSTVGGRGFACLDDDGTRWGLYWGWTDDRLDRDGRIGVPGK